MDLTKFCSEQEIEISEDLLAKLQKGVDESEDGLKAKRDELLEANKKLRKDHKAAVADLEEATGKVEDLEKKVADAEAERDEARQHQADPEAQEKLKAIYQQQADKRVAEVEGDRDKWKEKAESLQEKDRQHAISTAFDRAFDEAHVIKDARKPLRLSMVDEAGDVEVDDDGDVTIDGIKVTDHVKGWADTDEAKIFIEAPKNGGGGATGGADGGEKGEVNPWDPKTRNLTEQGKMFKADPDRARRMAAQHGITINA